MSSETTPYSVWASPQGQQLQELVLRLSPLPPSSYTDPEAPILKELTERVRSLEDNLAGVQYRLNYIEERGFLPSAKRVYDPSVSYETDQVD